MKGTWLNNLCSPIFPHIKCEHLSCTVDPKPGIVLQMQLQMCQTEKETIVTLALLLLLKPMMQLAFITTWAHCLFIIPACPGLPAKLLSVWVMPSLYTCMGTPSQAKDFALPLSNFTTLLSGHPLQHIRLPVSGNLTPSAATAPTNSVSILTQICWGCLLF